MDIYIWPLTPPLDFKGQSHLAWQQKQCVTEDESQDPNQHKLKWNSHREPILKNKKKWFGKKKSSGAGFLSSLQYIASDICWECFNFWHQLLVGHSYRGRTEQSGGNHHRCHQTASVWTDHKDLFKSQSVHEAENISSDPRHQLFYLRLKCCLQTTAKGWNPAIEIWTVNSSLRFIFFYSVFLSAGLISGQW